MKKIIINSLIILLTLVCVYLIWDHFEKKEQPDNVKFSIEYTNVPKDNVFVYKTIDEVIELLETGTGIVYLGFPECPWCQAYVPYVNEAAKETGIEEIYYYNIREDRKNNTEKYQKIVSLLKEELLLDEDKNPRVYVPDITVVKDGKIVGHNNETSVVTEEDGTPKEYWTEEKIVTIKTTFKEMFSKASTVCTSCN